MKRIIVALPTCGKTYACKRIIHGTDLKAVDLDIRGSKDLLTPEVRYIQTMYVKAVFNAGCDIVFTHNGAIDFDLLNPNEVEVDIVVRNCEAKEYAKLCAKRGDSKHFVARALKSYDQWVDGMADLRDSLDTKGFKTRFIMLGVNPHIWDYLSNEIKDTHFDCEGEN